MSPGALGAVLFDMDGTLVDTERQSGEALAHVFASRYGVELGTDALDRVLGAAWDDALAALHERHHISERDPAGLKEALLNAKEDALAGQMTVLPGARAALRAAASRWPVAVVTGSWRVEAEQALAEMGVADAVRFILASENVEAGKPSPEGYRAAAARLGVPGGRCMVLEDSMRGVAAALGAGAFTVALRAGSLTPGELKGSGAHAVLDSLEGLSHPEAYEDLYASGKT
jgi:HAD superfamily hydrolase (TIGR01509 family)